MANVLAPLSPATLKSLTLNPLPPKPLNTYALAKIVNVAWAPDCPTWEDRKALRMASPRLILSFFFLLLWLIELLLLLLFFAVVVC